MNSVCVRELARNRLLIFQVKTRSSLVARGYAFLSLHSVCAAARPRNVSHTLLILTYPTISLIPPRGPARTVQSDISTFPAKREAVWSRATAPPRVQLQFRALNSICP
jgi:hypothetical protein